MTNNKLNSPINVLNGVGPKAESLLFSLGIQTIKDAIYYFPFRFDDFSEQTAIKDVKPDEKITIKAKINAIHNNRSYFRKMAITEAILSDKTATIKAVWYNQPFLTRSLKPENKYLFHGKVKLSKNRLFLQSPSFESLNNEKKSNNDKKLIPIYHVTKGVTPKMLRYYIKQALEMIDELEEYLPESILKKQNLIPLKQAIKLIHLPKNIFDIKKAKKRLAFNELFAFQLSYQLKKIKWKNKQSIKIPKKIEFLKKIISSLPFTLTNDQKISLWEIVKDIDSKMPANRLLEGDVGSGKTVVAAIPCFSAAKSKSQSAIMTPTEILAFQHYKEVEKINQNLKFPIALITNSMSYYSNKTSSRKKIKKGELIKKIKKGEIKIIIGTHSIIQKKIKFKNLNFVVIDEQHRFGVEQRSHLIKNANLTKKEITPHLLSMSATPIPRTLALTIYGDLDISLIREMPKGRKKIITKIVPPSKRSKAYDFIRTQIKKGRQIFVICPLIEESETLQTKSVLNEYERLNKQIFPDISVGLLHGRLKSKEKDEIMKKFKKNKISILVSTSVVEVGVNVPNATIMMIEGAERFGLSQLHQFRGRVGRGKHQSYCFLFTESPSSKTWQRLKYLEETDNGFELAKKDLKLRGPGEFLGDRQSGFTNLTIASLSDSHLIKMTRKEAENLIKNDPKLNNHPKIKKRMKNFQQEAHFE